MGHSEIASDVADAISYFTAKEPNYSIIRFFNGHALKRIKELNHARKSKTTALKSLHYTGDIGILCWRLNCSKTILIIKQRISTENTTEIGLM